MSKPVYSLPKKILWYLSHPKHWRHFIFAATRRMKWALVGREQNQQEAKVWCQAHLQTDEQIIEQVTGQNSIDLPEELMDLIQTEEKKLTKYNIKLGDGANLSLLYQLIFLTSTRKVIETGVAYGWSSLVILFALKDKEGHQLISTDKPMPNEDYNSMVGIVVQEKFLKNWDLMKEADVEAIPKALKKLGAYDLCHYDSDKSYEGRTWAYKKLWDNLKPGGVFISDDISDNLAFKHFCEKVDRKPWISHSVTSAGDRYVGVLIK